MGPFFLMTFKKQVTFIIFRYTALGGMGRDKKLYQLVATFPHACLELALAVSPPSHLVCCRKRICGCQHAGSSFRAAVGVCWGSTLPNPGRLSGCSSVPLEYEIWHKITPLVLEIRGAECGWPLFLVIINLAL